MIWSRICIKCSSGLLRRSKTRNLRERLIRFAVAPYRCECCDARGFRLRFRIARRPAHVNAEDRVA